MQQLITKDNWENYTKKELEYFTPILSKHGYTLDKKQPQIQGERFLMQALTTTSGKKVILFGTNREDKRVVIKATRDQNGSKEILDERKSRELLQKIKFAYQVFHSPEELYFEKSSNHTIFIQEFIEQEVQFIDRPIKEQFTLALKAFKAQEGARAITYEHEKLIRNAFSYADKDFYLQAFQSFTQNIDQSLHPLLEKAGALLKKHQDTIDLYRGFLTHTDFVPHNIRIEEDTIYLLDHSSLRFGNKYEGWARFLNFMVLYNKELEEAFLYYLKENRSEEELLSLKLMRVYRLGEIISFYSKNLQRTRGDLHTLTQKRIELWSSLLQAILSDTEMPKEMLQKYKKERDALRSTKEKERQKNLH